MSETPENELARYDFHLPQELIAQTPAARRVDARLMVVDRKNGTICHHYVRDFPDFLQPNDCLVLNDTKVVPARLIGRRVRTGGRWEGLFLETANADYASEFAHALTSQHGTDWVVMSKTRGKLMPGEKIELQTPGLQTPDCRSGLFLETLAKLDDGNWLVRPLSDKNSGEKPFDFLERVGWVPIPPYIRNGRMVPPDKEQYQTVYASKPGAIAAPTAGLHFSQELLQQIQNKRVEIVPVTLHVGAGTFRPISVRRLDDHVMHFEWGEISEQAVARIQKRKQSGGRVVAIGTTSVRLLESASDEQHFLRPFSAKTNLFIRPGYIFRTVDAMLTNFHLPLSTLMILVRTFGGDVLIREAYEEAIRNKYRFYSYGDAMLIL